LQIFNHGRSFVKAAQEHPDAPYSAVDETLNIVAICRITPMRGISADHHELCSAPFLTCHCGRLDAK
jgi:hypothetical protein